MSWPMREHHTHRREIWPIILRKRNDKRITQALLWTLKPLTNSQG
jgi:hypothetical protein